MDQPICGNDYTYFNYTGNCYKFYLLNVSHADAKTLCESDSALLTSIHSSRENEFLRTLYDNELRTNQENDSILQEMESVWLGVRFDGFKGSAWEDGSALGFDNTTKNVEKKADQYWRTMDFVGSWKPADKETRASVLCKKRSSKETISQEFCSPTYSFLNSTKHCYKIGFDFLTFEEATAKCAEDGAHLMSIHSQLELNSLVEFYKTSLRFQFGELAYEKRAFLWLGLTFNSTSWTWSDGTPYDYRNWKFRVSSSAGKRWSVIIIDSCLSKTSKTADTFWKPVGAPNYFSYICKKPINSTGRLSDLKQASTTPEPKTHQLASNYTNCTDGYELFYQTGYCYKSIPDSVDFFTADKNCRLEKANLASIHSKEENEFVVWLTKRKDYNLRLYIGLSYINDHWEWSDGSPVDYTNWMVGEPNYIYENWPEASEYQTTIFLEERDSLNSRKDEWNNLQKNTRNGYICKMRAF